MCIIQFAEEELGIKHLSYNEKEILRLLESNKYEKLRFPRDNQKRRTIEIYLKYLNSKVS